MKKYIIYIIAGAAALAAAAVGIFIYTSIKAPGIEIETAGTETIIEETQYVQAEQEGTPEPEIEEKRENNGVYYLDIESVTMDEDFINTMIDYPLEDMIGEKLFVDNPSDIQELIDAFENVWFRQYDEQIIIQQRPYTIEYDAQKGIYIVKGSNVCTGEVCLGILSVMVSEETGEVLSAWGLK